MRLLGLLTCVFCSIGCAVLGAEPAKIVINSPTPLIYINNRRTFQALAGSTITFNVAFYNAVPLPETWARIRYLRLLYAEEEPHRIGKQECDDDNAPCTLDYALIANEFADSIHTARGVDESGDTIVEESFYVTVDEAVNPSWQCITTCTQQVSGYLIITPEIEGYPTPHLYQVEESSGKVIEEILAETNRVMFNLSESQVGVGTVLTLVATNYLNESISMDISSPFTTTSTVPTTITNATTAMAATTPSNDAQKQPANTVKDPLFIGLLSTAAVVVIAVLVTVLVVCCHKHSKIDSEANHDERVSLTMDTSSSQSSGQETSKPVLPEQLPKSTTINIFYNSEPHVETPSVDSIQPGEFQPRMDSAGPESSRSIGGDTMNSLEGDGPADEQEHQLEDLKRFNNDSDSDLETDCSKSMKPQSCTDDPRTDEGLGSPVQEEGHSFKSHESLASEH